VIPEQVDVARHEHENVEFLSFQRDAFDVKVKKKKKKKKSNFHFNVVTKTNVLFFFPFKCKKLTGTRLESFDSVKHDQHRRQMQEIGSDAKHVERHNARHIKLFKKKIKIKK
jgi:hypothetical protein